ncbi:MAG: penicillin-insensitive murein endopeptidase [Myxococcales bacterium]|nr:penicillin-insensitive murein endopeptidase [Myxococcales bacterium]
MLRSFLLFVAVAFFAPLARAESLTLELELDADLDAGAVVAEADAGVEAALASYADAVDESDPADELMQQLLLDAGYRSTLDLSDAELNRLWLEDPAALGSISVGHWVEGRLINAIPFPEPLDGGAWSVIVPQSCWTTEETAEAVINAANQLRAWFPSGAPVRVGQVSGPKGGLLSPHRTHQSGRDVDIGLFYPEGEPYRVIERERVMDVAMNWAFVKALLIHGDVHYVLLDWRVQNVLYAYARRQGEDRAWLDSLFKAGPYAVFHHAPMHRDHFHVRYWNPRAQELAFRLSQLLAFHRVELGDTLTGIAVKYGSSVSNLKTRNRLANHLVRLGQVLRVPLAGPCFHCPAAPIPTVPPRRLPPERPSG